MARGPRIRPVAGPAPASARGGMLGTGPARTVTVRVPAKVNLQLAVGAPRRDGFHDLATVFHAVSVYDEIAAERGPGVAVRVTGSETAGVPTGEANLAFRAAVALAERAGIAPAVSLTLHKSIPVAGGMAGGSADAAGALLACDALWETGLEREDLLGLAAGLGSDVPFALVGGTAIGLGRGDRITPALAHGQFEWVFAVAEQGLSTRAVYAETDRLRAGRILPEPRPSDAVLAALRAGDAPVLGRALHNDLQPAACSLRPELHKVLSVGEDNGALGCLVSGSGPTCAFLARDREHSEDLAAALLAAGVCAAVHRAHGPVHGARIVDSAVR